MVRNLKNLVVFFGSAVTSSPRYDFPDSYLLKAPFRGGQDRGNGRFWFIHV